MGLGGTPDSGPDRLLPKSAAAGSSPLGLRPCPPRGGRRPGRRRHNVVGCFDDCHPHSRLLWSTPLGLSATGRALRGKSPLIWSWKEGGKVILRCLRRWVIGPQLLARTRAQCRLPPVGGGSGQRLAEMPRVVNKLQVPVPPARVPFCVRPGREMGGRRDEEGEASGRGRQAGGRRGKQSLFYASGQLSTIGKSALGGGRALAGSIA